MHIAYCSYEEVLFVTGQCCANSSWPFYFILDLYMAITGNDNNCQPPAKCYCYAVIAMYIPSKDIACEYERENLTRRKISAATTTPAICVQVVYYHQCRKRHKIL